MPLIFNRHGTTYPPPPYNADSVPTATPTVFEDPEGHLLEVITRPYGSGGWNP